jgi:hypothetical protein
MPYIVRAQTRGGLRSKRCHGAYYADAWVREFEEHGAHSVTVEKDGVVVSSDDLARLIREEAATPRGNT